MGLAEEKQGTLPNAGDAADLAQTAIDKASTRTKGSEGKGRMDPHSQERELDGALLKKLAPSLMRLHSDVKEAQDALTAGIKKASLETAYKPSVIRTLIGGKNSRNPGLFYARQEQLQIAIFETL